jgi:hypothetical protein
LTLTVKISSKLKFTSTLTESVMTPAQRTALKAAILADPVLSLLPLSNATHEQIRDAFNLVGSVDVWQTAASVQAIIDAIDFTKFTPADAVPTSATELVYLNRSQLVLIKQNNLSMLLQGRETIDASKPTLRAAIRDAVTALPTGVSGANVSAGGASASTVLSSMMRKARRIEALFATVDSTTGSSTAKLLVFEGTITADEVAAAREMG